MTRSRMPSSAARSVQGVSILGSVLPDELPMGRRVAERAFQIHAGTYVLVNLFLVVIWALTGAG